jgi:cholesterol transport system auxiliary component
MITAARGARRPTPGSAVALLTALAATLVLGCALTSKNEPIVPRYFSPDVPTDAVHRGPRPTGPALDLRLGHIGSAANLDERLVYRDSPYELGYYQERRWTEVPEEYLKRKLAIALFQERSLRHVVGGAAPTLDVDLVAFEEVRAPKRVARVQVTVRLHDVRSVRWEETLTVEQPLTVAAKGDLPDEMVQALGVALQTVVGRIADRVVTELSALASTPPTPPAGTTTVTVKTTAPE